MKKATFPVFVGVAFCLLGVGKAHAQIIVDNFPGANGFSSGFVSLSSGNLLAQSFLNGPNAYTSVDVTIQVNAKTTDPLRLGIFADFAGTPAIVPANFVTATPVGTGAQVLTFANILTGLNPGGKYWAVLGSTAAEGVGSDFFWFHSNNGGNLGEGTVLTGGEGAILRSSTSGLTWEVFGPPTFTGSTSYQLRIAASGASAPEPGSLLLILCGAGWGLALRRRKVRSGV
ncbi:MAG: choice-of-anchor R domain-containing protein [Capsulimonadales bacterium]|nr:choice-of-anchor R domain-containing protein [Capsulimonadales bacterium]